MAKKQEDSTLTEKEKKVTSSKKIAQKKDMVVEKVKEQKESKKSASAKVGKPKSKAIAPVEIVAIPSVEKKAKKTTKATSTKATLLDTVTTQYPTHITFRLRFSTKFGQHLFLTGNHDLLGNNLVEQAIPLTYIDNNFWGVSLVISQADLANKEITYNYILRNADSTVSYDCGADKKITESLLSANKVLIIDSWNYTGFFENAFYSEPFQHVLFKDNFTPLKAKSSINSTHIFRAKAPLLQKGQTLAIIGSGKSLGIWNPDKAVLLAKEESNAYFEVKLDLSNDIFPVHYKYGVYDIASKKLVHFEDGANRKLEAAADSTLKTILNDGFAVFPTTTWKGAGIAIPVFSLRSSNSFGVGEFTDLPAFVDWSKKVGLKLVQILPINDTTSTHTWVDSYPYAAISAFALHPLYLNVASIALTDAEKTLVASYEEERFRLNQLDAVDYDGVMLAKWSIIRQLYTTQKGKVFKSADYKKFFELNKHWLVPYACFCYLRDTNGTAEFSNWPSYQLYREQEMGGLTDEAGEAYKEVALHYFTQYHLHLQLKSATDYAHKNGIIVKGDIAIGISRNSADAWQHPALYHMELQAGAPPDDFAIKGQNWGFPTYNWQKMKQDGFAWWKQRFEQMSYYFDAFRIDHILGFFRIWSIPLHAVEGIMGYFVPSLPLHINELRERGVWYDTNRFTMPFIDDHVLWEIFGYDNEFVKKRFLNHNDNGGYTLKEEVNTQRKVEQYLASWAADNFTNKMKYGLFDLISNVILFEAAGSNGDQFHFRFGISSTSSCKHLDEHTRRQLDDLYVNYFFRRQDNFWMQEAMQKLPALKRGTNMLVCGEDLGLVPDCVPEVMKQLGILSLEIQRMPKDNSKTFFHPNDAPYLSVVTPSTHDMSTIRGWWEEDKARIQKFYNNELGQWGNAPYYCEAWVNKAIVLQHLYSPAMWSVFQLQDILGIDEGIRRKNPNDERINVPANPKNYWRYRMHISLEDLLQSDNFNNELKGMIIDSGRGI